MWRESDTVAVTPRQAIAALRHAFGDDYAVTPDRLLAAFEEVSVPGSERSRNHIVRVIRMLMDLGLKTADLAAAVVEMRDTGWEPFPSRGANPYGDEVVESSHEPSGSRCTRDGHEKFKQLCEYHLPYAKLDAIRKDPAPPVGTAVNLLTEQEFECAIVVKPSVFAAQHGVEDPYGEGYPDLLCALAHRVRTSYERLAHGTVSASFLELRQYDRLELHPLTRRWLERAERETQGDFLALPVQTGKRWRGSSMARVAWHCQHADFRIGLFWREVPLPAYVALFELWFDPYRLYEYDGQGVLAIDCPGDIVRLQSDPRPAGLSFLRGRGNLHLIPRDRHRPEPQFAPATGLTL